MPSYEQIEKAVRGEVTQNLRVADPFELSVEVIEGNVTLRGIVTTYYQKRLAEEDTRDVFNTINVNRVFTFSDNALRQAIKRRLASNADLLWLVDRIKVEVENGRAILKGSVDTWSEYREAARVTLLTEGIRGLDNQMTVAGVKHHWEEWK